MKHDKLRAFHTNDELVTSTAKANAIEALGAGKLAEAQRHFEFILGILDDLPQSKRREYTEWGMEYSAALPEVQKRFKERWPKDRLDPPDMNPERPSTSEFKEWFLRAFRLKPPQRPHK